MRKRLTQYLGEAGVRIPNTDGHAKYRDEVRKRITELEDLIGYVPPPVITLIESLIDTELIDVVDEWWRWSVGPHTFIDEFFYTHDERPHGGGVRVCSCGFEASGVDIATVDQLWMEHMEENG